MHDDNLTRPAWAEIDLSAIAHNMAELRRVTKSSAKMMAIVKANGYGHGAVPVSQVALKNGAEYLGVAILNEAIELRNAGITAPILILGFTPREHAAEAVKADVTQTVYNFKGALAIGEAALKLGKVAKVHIKVDTGMGRLGLAANNNSIDEILNIAKLPGIELEGMFTHFAVSDIRDKNYTNEQFEKFMELDSQLRLRGLQIPIRHTANSAAIIDLPYAHLDMVRAGVSLYGLYPSDEVEKEKVELKPALGFKARIANVKVVPSGISISYGRTYVTDRETVVATVPVGYADGYTRLYSNKTSVLIKGRRVPVIGRVCMDQFMIDVTGVPEVEIDNEVVLIGQQGDQNVSADELAGLIGTINYEVVCMVSPRVPRLYLDC